MVATVEKPLGRGSWETAICKYLQLRLLFGLNLGKNPKPSFKLRKTKMVASLEKPMDFSTSGRKKWLSRKMFLHWLTKIVVSVEKKMSHGAFYFMGYDVILILVVNLWVQWNGIWWYSNARFDRSSNPIPLRLEAVNHNERTILMIILSKGVQNFTV